jgi:hypothetical protein
MLHGVNYSEITAVFIYYLIANGVLPGGSDTTMRHNTQVTHTTQKTHHIQQNTAHKTTQAIKDTLHKMNTMKMLRIFQAYLFVRRLFKRYQLQVLF